jgi:hypothetical protein
MLGQSLPATMSFASAETVVYSGTLGSSTYHTVKFLDEDGSTVLAEQLVATGTEPVEPQAPTKEDYEFAGWSPAVGAITTDTDYTATYTALEKISVTVRYLKAADDSSAASSKVVQLKKKGDSTTVTSPDVVGYTPQHASVDLTVTAGTVTATDGATSLTVDNNDTVTVYYDVATAQYTIRYLFENLSGSGYDTDLANYPDVTKSANVNEMVSPAAADYVTVPGFETPSDVVGVVKGDNSTVLELKYTARAAPSPLIRTARARWWTPSPRSTVSRSPRLTSRNASVTPFSAGLRRRRAPRR